MGKDGQTKQEAFKGPLIAINEDLAGSKFNALSNNYRVVFDTDPKVVFAAITYINGAPGENLKTAPEEVKKACAVLIQINQDLTVSTECINNAIKNTDKCLVFFKDKKSSHSRTTLMKFKKVLEAALNYLSVLNFINWAVGKHFYTILIKAYKKFTSAVLFLKALLVTATNKDSVGGENKKILLDTIKNLEIPFKLLHDPVLKLAIKFSNGTLAADDNYKTEELDKVSQKITEANETIAALIKVSEKKRRHQSAEDVINYVNGTLRTLSPLLIDVSSNKKKGPIKRNFSKSNDFDLDFIKLISALEKFYNEPAQENLDNFKQLVDISSDGILRLPTKAALFTLRGVLDEFLKTLSKLFTVMEIFMNTAQSSEFSEVENTQNPDNQADRSNTNIHNDNGKNRKVTGLRYTAKTNRQVQTPSGLNSQYYSYSDSDSSDQPPPNNRNQKKVKQKQSQGGSSKGFQPPGKNNSNSPEQPQTNKQNQNNAKPKQMKNSQTSNDNDSSKRPEDNTNTQRENPVGNSEIDSIVQVIAGSSSSIRALSENMNHSDYTFEAFTLDWGNNLSDAADYLRRTVNAIERSKLIKKTLRKSSPDEKVLKIIKEIVKLMEKLAKNKKADRKAWNSYYKKFGNLIDELNAAIQNLNENSALWEANFALGYLNEALFEFNYIINAWWNPADQQAETENQKSNKKLSKDIKRLEHTAHDTLLQTAAELNSLLNKIKNYNRTLDNFARDWRGVLDSAKLQLDRVIQDLDALVAAGGKSWKGFVGKFSKALEKKLSRSRNIVILLRELRQLTIDMYENENATRDAWNNYFSELSDILNSLRDSIGSLENRALLYPLRAELNGFREAFANLMAQMSTYGMANRSNQASVNQNNSENSSSGSKSGKPKKNSKPKKPDNPENNHNDSIEEEEEEFSSHSASSRSNGKTQPAVGTETKNTNADENKPQNNDSIDTPLGNQLRYAIEHIQNNINIVQNPDLNFTQEVPLDHTRPVYDFNNAANIVSYLDRIIGNMDDLLPKKKYRFSKEQDPSGHALMRHLRRLRNCIQKFCSIDAPDHKQWQSFYESYQQIMKVLYGDAGALSDSLSLFQYTGMFMRLFNEIDRLMRAIAEHWGRHIRKHPESAQPPPPRARKKFRSPFGKLPVETEQDVESSRHELQHSSSSASNEENPSTATGSRRAVGHNTLPSVHLYRRPKRYTSATDFKHNKNRSKRTRKASNENEIPGDPGSEYMNASADPSESTTFLKSISEPASINNDEVSCSSSFMNGVSEPASVNDGRSSSNSSNFGLVSEPPEFESSFFSPVSEPTTKGRRKNKPARRILDKSSHGTGYHIADPQPDQLMRNHWESFENNELQMYFALLYGYDFPQQTSKPRKYLFRNNSYWPDDKLNDTLEYALIEHIGDFSDKDLKKALHELNYKNPIFTLSITHKLRLLVNMLQHGQQRNAWFSTLAKNVAKFDGTNPAVILDSNNIEFSPKDLQSLKNAIPGKSKQFFEALEAEIDTRLSNRGTHRKRKNK